MPAAREPSPDLPDWVVARNMAARQLDLWFTKRRRLPEPEALSCGMCRGGRLYMRWRSARDAVKVACTGCGREVDVPRSEGWKVRFKALRQPSEE
jgi:hypothetical protein